MARGGRGDRGRGERIGRQALPQRRIVGQGKGEGRGDKKGREVVLPRRCVLLCWALLGQAMCVLCVLFFLIYIYLPLLSFLYSLAFPFLSLHYFTPVSVSIYFSFLLFYSVLLCAFPRYQHVYVFVFCRTERVKNKNMFCVFFFSSLSVFQVYSCR